MFEYDSENLSKGTLLLNSYFQFKKEHNLFDPVQEDRFNKIELFSKFRPISLVSTHTI